MNDQQAQAAEEAQALNNAIDLVTEYFSDAVDKSGQPYILHLLAVMMAHDNNDDRIVAVLHDLIEDTMLSLTDLRKWGYTEPIVKAIGALTRRDGETYEDYITRLSENERAVRVKITDLIHNLSRLHKLPKEERLRLYDRYWTALGRLQRLNLASDNPQPVYVKMK